MKRIFSLATFFLLFASSAQAWNLDGYRQGFMLGFGGGFHHTRLDFDSSNDLYYSPAPGQTLRYKDSKSETNFATNFKIGYGILDQLAIQYVAYTAWYKSSNDVPVFSHKSQVANTVHGLGLTYYFSKEAPSIYLMAAAGKATMRTPFEKSPEKDGGDTSHHETGNGTLLTFGWEFYHRQSIELTWMRSEFKDLKSNSGDVDIDSSSFMFSYNYLFY